MEAGWPGVRRHDAPLRETDPGHTVIMIQMENEVGLLGDSRDRSKEANDAFAAAVPRS